MSRPYDPEIGNQIVDRIAAGESVTSISKTEFMPSAAQIWRWLEQDKDFKAEYDIAIKCKSHALVDKIDTIDELLLSHEITAPEAKILSDNLKWKASRYFPASYGDKTQQDIKSVSVTIDPQERKLTENDIKILEDLGLSGRR
jgi:hypothetical protein